MNAKRWLAVVLAAGFGLLFIGTASAAFADGGGSKVVFVVTAGPSPTKTPPSSTPASTGTHTTSPVHSSSANGGTGPANTGTPVAQLLVLGAALVLAGLLLVLAVRRRADKSARHLGGKQRAAPQHG
jgi:LPXTG-motif cell wall-anchored protein